MTHFSLPISSVDKLLPTQARTSPVPIQGSSFSDVLGKKTEELGKPRKLALVEAALTKAVQEGKITATQKNDVLAYFKELKHKVHHGHHHHHQGGGQGLDVKAKIADMLHKANGKQCECNDGDADDQTVVEELSGLANASAMIEASSPADLEAELSQIEGMISAMANQKGVSPQTQAKLLQFLEGLVAKIKAALEAVSSNKTNLFAPVRTTTTVDAETDTVMAE